MLFSGAEAMRVQQVALKVIVEESASAIRRTETESA